MGDYYTLVECFELLAEAAPQELLAKADSVVLEPRLPKQVRPSGFIVNRFPGWSILRRPGA